MLKTRFLKKLNENILCVWKRLQSTTPNEKQSFRQKAWHAARQRYVNYEYVHYSSFLEYYLGQRNKFDQINQAVFPPLEVLSALQSDVSPIPPSYPPNWMDDYEFYAGASDGAGNIDSQHGTADATVPPSTVPCNGCGAHLHCANTSMPGYIPSEIFKGRTKTELQTITCQRCHFLKNYNIALDVEVPPSAYVETISRIQDKYALAIIIVDLLDFPCSIWPGMQQVIGSKRPVFLVGNKVDLLPRDCNNYLTHVKSCLKQQFIEHGGFNALNIKNVSLISAKTGFGIEELITQLHNVWAYKGDVYLVGCTNVGKSSLFNILLNSDYCRTEASELVRKATTCAWPGTTLQMLKFPILRPSDIRIYQRYKRLFAEREQRAALEKMRREQAKDTGAVTSAQLIGTVGRTFDNRLEVDDAFAMPSGTQPIVSLNERKPEYREARWVYDTPGVMQPDQLTPLLTTQELLHLQPTKMLKPRAVRLPSKMSLLLGGLARVDLLECNRSWVKLFVFAAETLPILIADTSAAELVYKRYLGTPLLGVPMSSGDEKRLQRWPGLQCMEKDIVVKNGGVDSIDDGKQLNCDIVLSSAGWLGLLMPENSECIMRVWTPQATGIYVRKPALIPLAERLVGKHIRHSLAYNTSKPFVFQK
ncbi:PREDICTED: nitric oxide-associated protein 1 [Drosophila arizonae]|uniref:Nitric oxide-associated protein 1 n=1 Tax=Drosophila arizonae TaxID=7263 RepID=A0ABM1PGY3_DROAR|nr:PREDICTED: nitric oxide-associated protein 1 [Drosophila arizonae]